MPGAFLRRELLEGASDQGGKEKAGEASRQQVAGDSPGYKERGSRRMVGVSYEEQGVEDAATREDACGVDDEGEDAGDESGEQSEREAEDEARAGTFPLGAPQEQGAAEYRAGDESGDKPDAHVDEGERRQVSLATLAALQDQEHERLGEERLDEHEAQSVGHPYPEQAQEHHSPTSVGSETGWHCLWVSIFMFGM